MKKSLSFLLSVTMTFLLVAGMVIPSFAASRALPKQIVNTKTNETYTFQYDKGNRTIRINITAKKTPDEEQYGYVSLSEETNALITMLGISDNIQYQNLSFVSEDPIVVFALWQPVREGQYDTVLISGKGITEKYSFSRSEEGKNVRCWPENHGAVSKCHYFYYDNGDRLSSIESYYYTKTEKNTCNGSLYIRYDSKGNLNKYDYQESTAPGFGETKVYTDSKGRVKGTDYTCFHGGGVNDTISTWEYDENGALSKRVTRWKEPEQKNNLIVETFTYSNGKLAGYTIKETYGGKTTTNSYKITY